MIYADYQNINDRIHAPDHLKEDVLQKARAMQRKPSRTLPKLLAAAALAAVIPLSVLAVTQMPGLREYLTRFGMHNTEAVEQLVEKNTQATPHSNDFADYLIEETLCDGNALYVRVKISPRDSSHFLVPEYTMLSDSIQSLELEGPAGQTVGEYLKAIKKEPVFASVWLGTNGEGSQGWCDPQGNLYYYITAQMPADGLLHVSGTAQTMQMREASRVTFEYEVENKASAQETTASRYDPRITESGIEMDSIQVEETELGYYVTFTWHKLYENRSVSLSLTDASGDYLPGLPAFSSGQTLNADGSYTQTLSAQKTVGMEDLYFVIQWGQPFGPYPVLAK